MKKVIIAVVVVFGVISLGIAAAWAPEATDVRWLIGTFLPGLLFLIIGLKLRQTEQPPKMKLWKLLAVGIFIALGLVGSARFFLPRFYSEDEQTAWPYHSPEYGFTMTLPSRDWTEIKRRDSVVAFYNRKHLTLVGVNVSRETRADFRQQSVPRLKKYFARTRDEFLSGPQYSTGETRSGNLYAFWKGQAKVRQGGAVFVAFSLVWCREKELTVQVTLEGRLTMLSEDGKTAELAFFEKAARTVCLSVE